MESYHLAWLKHHPERTAEWLLERLEDGFDVHHLDGDHSNDDPLNLVLIEHADHFRLHYSPPIRYLPRAACPETRQNLAATAYALKDDKTSWRDVARLLNFQATDPASLRSIVAKYAREQGLPFPKPGSTMDRGIWNQKLRVSKKLVA